MGTMACTTTLLGDCFSLSMLRYLVIGSHFCSHHTTFLSCCSSHESKGIQRFLSLFLWFNAGINVSSESALSGVMQTLMVAYIQTTQRIFLDVPDINMSFLYNLFSKSLTL